MSYCSGALLRASITQFLQGSSSSTSTVHLRSCCLELGVSCCHMNIIPDHKQDGLKANKMHFVRLVFIAVRVESTSLVKSATQLFSALSRGRSGSSSKTGSSKICLERYPQATPGREYLTQGTHPLLFVVWWGIVCPAAVYSLLRGVERGLKLYNVV